MDREVWWLQSSPWGCKESDTSGTWVSHTHTHNTSPIFVVVFNFSCAEIHTKSVGERTQRGYVNNLWE